MKKLTREEVRSFFARRPFLRPGDYEEIKSKTTGNDRHKMLSVFCLGYMSAKDSPVYKPEL